MIMRNKFCLLILLVSMLPMSVMAEDYEYHPILSDAFTVDLGVMISSNSFDISANSSDSDLGGKEIDFDTALGVDSSDAFFDGQVRWKFGHEGKWSLWGQYFSNKATGSATLQEDVTWLDTTFREGSFVQAGTEMAVTRLFFGRSLYKNAQNDFGVGIGIHNLALDAYIEGEVDTNDGSTGLQKLSVGESQILPNIGTWYNYSPARRWLLHGRVDWISANVGDYDGHLWNATAGVNFQAWRHVGFDLSWQYFNLDVNVDTDNWNGSVSTTYSGPVASVSFAW